MERRRHLDCEYEKHRIRVRKIVVAIVVAAAIILSAFCVLMFSQQRPTQQKTYVYDTFYYNDDEGIYYAYISELCTESSAE